MSTVILGYMYYLMYLCCWNKIEIEITWTVIDDAFDWWIGIEDEPIRRLCTVYPRMCVGDNIAVVPHPTSPIHSQNIEACVGGTQSGRLGVDIVT